MSSLVGIILLLFAAYLIVGLFFGAYFVLNGVKKIDPDAVDSSLGFRILLFPGSVALWPVLLKRLHAVNTSPSMEKTAHKNALR